MTSRKRGKNADQSVEDWLSERLDFELDEPPTEIVELSTPRPPEAPTAPPSSAPRGKTKRKARAKAKAKAAPIQRPPEASPGPAAGASEATKEPDSQDSGLWWPNWQPEPLPEFQDPGTGPGLAASLDQTPDRAELTADLLKGGDTRPLPKGMPLPIDAGPGLPSWGNTDNTNSLLANLGDTTAGGVPPAGAPSGPTTRPLPPNPDEDQTTGEVRPNHPTVPLPVSARIHHPVTSGPPLEPPRFDPPGTPARPGAGLPPKVSALSAARANPRAKPTEVLGEPPPRSRPPAWSDAEDVHDAPTVFTNDGYIEQALQELGPRPQANREKASFTEDIHDAPTMAVSALDNPAAFVDPEPAGLAAERPTTVMEEPAPRSRPDNFSKPADPDIFLFEGDDPAQSPRTSQGDGHQPHHTPVPRMSRAWLAWTGASVGLLLFVFLFTIGAALLWLAT